MVFCRVIHCELVGERDRILRAKRQRIKKSEGPTWRQTKKNGQGAQKYKIILKIGNPVYPDTKDWIPVYIPVTIQSGIWKVEQPSRTLYSSVSVTSHSGIYPIPELDGHPNLEIPIWDGIKLRNIPHRRRYWFVVVGNTTSVPHWVALPSLYYQWLYIALYWQ